MKKLTLMSVVAMLCLQVNAQQPPDNAGYAEKEIITPLNIGDKIPDALWDMPLQVVNHPDGRETITLREYKDKLIILDFWATWCGPCIRSLAKLDTLQNEFKGSVAVIPVSYEPDDKVGKFLRTQGRRLPSVHSDTTTGLYFPHLIIPHQIIINQSTVQAITDGEKVNSQAIADLLVGKHPQFKLKKEIFRDKFQPIFLIADSSGKTNTFQSTLTGYIDGLHNSGRPSDGSRQQIYMFNAPIFSIYKFILSGVYPYEIELDVQDTTWFSSVTEDVYDNLFCYQLIAPAKLSRDEMRNIAIANINTSLGLNARFERKTKDCYIIVDNNTGSTQAPKDTLNKGRYSMKTVVGLLNFSLSWQSDARRFLNESGYSGPFWAKYPDAEFASLKTDIDKLNVFLADYNLKVVKEPRKVDVFIISENQTKF